MDIEKVLADIKTRHNNYGTQHGLYCNICGDVEMTCGPLRLAQSYEKLRSDKLRDSEDAERLRTDLAAQNHVLSVTQAHRDELIEDIEAFDEDVERLLFVWQFMRDSLDTPDIICELLIPMFGDPPTACNCKEAICPHARHFPMSIEDVRYAINVFLTKMKGEQEEIDHE